jgi:hypothetical protein
VGDGGGWNEFKMKTLVRLMFNLDVVAKCC